MTRSVYCTYRFHCNDRKNKKWDRLLTSNWKCNHKNRIEKCHCCASLTSCFKKVSKYYCKWCSWSKCCNLKKKKLIAYYKSNHRKKDDSYTIFYHLIIFKCYKKYLYHDKISDEWNNYCSALFLLYYLNIWITITSLMPYCPKVLNAILFVS